MLRTATVILLLTLGFGSTAHSGGSRVTGGHDANSACLAVPKPMVAALGSGLKVKARGRLGTARAVKSTATISFPRGFRAGTHFVSARVRGFGVATWAADASAFRTGGGFITGVGPTARRVSVLGVDIPAFTLSAWGLTQSTQGTRRHVAAFSRGDAGEPRAGVEPHPPFAAFDVGALSKLPLGR